MTLAYLKERIRSAYDTMKLVPVEILEQDFRLAMIRNQLAIIIAEIEDAEEKPPVIEDEGEVPEGYGGCGQCQDPEHITAEAEYYVRNKVLKGRTDL